MRKLCNSVIKYSIYILVFLMPLFWLPWTIEAYEFNKQYLLFFLTGLALLAWLVKMIVVQRKIVFRRTPLDIWILLFMLMTVLSTVFSIDKISSWLGFYGRFSDSVIGLLCLGIIYFLITNNIASPKKWGLSIEKISQLFLASSFLSIIGTFLSIFNVWNKIPNLPQAMTFRSFNLTNTSLEGMAIFLVMVIGFLTGNLLLHKQCVGKEKLLIASQGKKKKDKGRFNLTIKIIGLVLSMILLIIINFKPAWFVLGIVMLFLLVMAFWTRLFKDKVNILLLPIILLLISGFYVTGFNANVGVLDGISSLDNVLPQEPILDYQTSRFVAWQTLKDSPVLGSGPATFMSDFVKYKPMEFNNSDFWNIRFNMASDQITEMVGTTGILGTLSYLLIIFVFLLIMFLSLQRLRKRHQSKSLKLDESREIVSALPFFLAWLALVAAQFVYHQNTALSFYFWLFTALGIIGWQKIESTPSKQFSFSFKKMPEVGLVINVVLLILVFVLVGLFYLGGQFYLADVEFREAVSNNEDVVQKIEKVVNLNKYRENYRRTLSQVYLINAWNEVNKPQAEQDMQFLQALSSGSIEQAREATVLSPNSVFTWENLGVVYRDARGLIGGTLPFALESFAKATELEPNNPTFFRERCRINLISEEKDWDETIGYCQKAIELKSNYLDAHVQLALAFEEKGDLEKAVQQMETILNKLKGVSFQRGSDLANAATEIYFQTGRLYYNLSRITEAIRMFEQSVIVNPDYANARYALGLSYMTNKRNSDALAQFQIIDQLVPGNENIQALIQQLTSPVE